ncbi:MAG: sigma-70 family RNA polymerase sigma factor [Planctomycetaceae bacterium]
MPGAINPEFCVEKYRSYLCLLARQELRFGLRGKLDASDIVQDTLLRAHTNREKFRGQSEAERIGWLRAILLNELAGAMRQFARQCRDIELERSLEQRMSQSSVRLADWMAADLSSPSQNAGQSEEFLRLALALADLPHEQREAIELHYLNGIPFAEIATLMGKSKPSVAGLIFRGVRSLRKRLGVIDSQVNHEQPTPGTDAT